MLSNIFTIKFTEYSYIYTEFPYIKKNQLILKMKFLPKFFTLLLVAVCVWSFHLSAQSDIFNEGFELGQIPAGWITADLDQKIPDQSAFAGDSDNSPWLILNLPSATNLDNFAIGAASWFSPLACCANDWIISPAITISAGTTAYLSWDFMQGQQEWPDGYKVLVSTTGGNISDFATNVNNLSTIVYTGDVIFSASSGCSATAGSCCASNGLNCCTDEYWADHCNGLVNYADVWGTEIANLSTYAGQTIHIAFHHDANDQVAILIDNIRVFEPALNEISIGNSILPSPYGFIPLSQTSPMNFATKVNNNGANNMNDIRLSVTINKWSAGNSVEVYSDNGALGEIPVLAGGAIADITNGVSWTPADTGTYEVIYHLTSSSDDENLDNNEARFYYVVNEEGNLGFMSRHEIYLIDGITDTLNFGGFANFTPGSPGASITSGAMSFPLTFSNASSILGLIPQLVVGAGNGYSPSTVLYFDVLSESISPGMVIDSIILATSGPLTNLIITPSFPQIFFDCPVDVAAGETVHIAVRQQGPGKMGLFLWDNYFDSGLVEVVVNDTLRGSIGQPGIIAIVGDAGPLEGLTIVSSTAGLSAEFEASITSGALCDVAWDFGDGSTGTGTQTSHIYTSADTYNVCVTVDGNTECTEITVSCTMNLDLVDVSAGSAEVGVTNGTAPLTYSWTLDGTQISNTNPAINLDPETTYILTVTDAGGCSESLTVTTTACSITLNVGISGGTNPIASASGGVDPYNYTWFNQNGDQVGTGTYLTNLPSDFYSVTVVDQEGCTASASFVIGAIEDITAIQSFLLYPNPTSNDFRFNLHLKEAAAVKAEIIGLDGKQIKTIINERGNTINQTVNVSDLSAGIYMIKINIDDKSFTQRLVIK